MLESIGHLNTSLNRPTMMTPLPPFPAFPSTERFKNVGTIQQSLDRLCRAIDSMEPISVVFGQAGVGKSLLAEKLREDYQESHHLVAIRDGSINNHLDLLQYLLQPFHVDTEGRDEISLRIELQKCLSQEDQQDKSILLIVDNSQRLTIDAFEAIQSATDLLAHGRPQIQAILLGSQKLEELLIGSCPESITQRIATRCYLQALNENETRSYIHSVIEECNAEPSDTITENALSTLFHFTNGIPRVINQLMTEAIDLAASKDCTAIDEGVIQSSWASLQQLPDPTENEEVMAHSHEIEFGELTDLDQEADLTMPPSVHPTVAPEAPQESFEAPPSQTLDSIIEQQLGVSPADHQTLQDEPMEAFFDHEGSSEFGFAGGELSVEEITESEDTFDAEAERRLLASLMGESSHANLFDPAEAAASGPILDVNPVPKENQTNDPRQPATDLNPFAEMNARHDGSIILESYGEDYLFIDSPADGESNPGHPSHPTHQPSTKVRPTRVSRDG